MKQDSFAQKMQQISAEADAEQRAEVEATLRRARFAKFRRIVLLLALLGIVSGVVAKREVINEQWQAVLVKTGVNQTNELAAKFGQNLNQIKATAAKRDELVGGL